MQDLLGVIKWKTLCWKTLKKAQINEDIYMLMGRLIINVIKSYYRIKNTVIKILTEVYVESDKDFKIHMEKKSQELDIFL